MSQPFIVAIVLKILAGFWGISKGHLDQLWHDVEPIIREKASLDVSNWSKREQVIARVQALLPDVYDIVGGGLVGIVIDLVVKTLRKRKVIP